MKNKKIIIAVVIALAVLIIGAIIICNLASGDSKFKDLEFKIKVTGLVEENIDKSILDEIDLVEGNLKMETAAKTIQEYNYEGLKFSEILDYLNVKEYEKIKFTAIDGYSVEIQKDDLKDAILMITDDGEIIEKDGGYLKLALPKIESKKWLNSIVEMEIM